MRALFDKFFASFRWCCICESVCLRVHSEFPRYCNTNRDLWLKLFIVMVNEVIPTAIYAVDRPTPVNTVLASIYDTTPCSQVSTPYNTNCCRVTNNNCKQSSCVEWPWSVALELTCICFHSQAIDCIVSVAFAFCVWDEGLRAWLNVPRWACFRLVATARSCSH